MNLFVRGGTKRKSAEAPAEKPAAENPRLPKHIAIIMDGNGRWAQRRGLPRIVGHRQGVHSVRTVVEECCRLGVQALSLYCLSSENWKRPQDELDQLMRLLKKYLVDERPTILKNNIRLRIAGRRDGLPDFVQAEMDRSLAASAANTGMTLCLAINYGGRSEIVDACRSLAEDVQKGRLPPEGIDENALARKLYTDGLPDPDLLIRTAGEMRISNFLLWQISYAEIWVTETCWPEFGIAELRKALADFGKRERRFGGLGG